MFTKKLLDTLNIINEINHTTEFEQADEILHGKLSDLVRIWKG